jgi:hypothetical protein
MTLKKVLFQGDWSQSQEALRIETVAREFAWIVGCYVETREVLIPGFSTYGTDVHKWAQENDRFWTLLT